MGSLTKASAQEMVDADTVAVDTIAVDSVAAPAIKYGYLSYDLALRQMPQYAEARQKVADLRASYDKEAKRVEDEFNKKYEAFLEGQRDFPRTILLKRQTELKEYMQKNVDFKDEMRRELKKADVEAMRPLKEALQGVLDRLVSERGYAFILNTDGNAFPALSPIMGEDVNDVVQEMLKEGETVE